MSSNKKNNKETHTVTNIKVNPTKLLIALIVMIFMFSIAYYLNMPFIAVFGIIAVIIGLIFYLKDLYNQS